MLSWGAAEPGDPPLPPQELFKKVVPSHCLGSRRARSTWPPLSAPPPPGSEAWPTGSSPPASGTGACRPATGPGWWSTGSRWPGYAHPPGPGDPPLFTPGLSSDLPPGGGALLTGPQERLPGRQSLPGGSSPPRETKAGAGKLGPPHGLSPCPAGVPGPQELLLPLRHPLCPAEQLHPPAEEDVGRGLQVGSPLPTGAPRALRRVWGLAPSEPGTCQNVRPLWAGSPRAHWP